MHVELQVRLHADGPRDDARLRAPAASSSARLWSRVSCSSAPSRQPVDPAVARPQHSGPGPPHQQHHDRAPAAIRQIRVQADVRSRWSFTCCTRPAAASMASSKVRRARNPRARRRPCGWRPRRRCGRPCRRRRPRSPPRVAPRTRPRCSSAHGRRRSRPPIGRTGALRRRPVAVERDIVRGAASEMRAGDGAPAVRGPAIPSSSAA